MMRSGRPRVRGMMIIAFCAAVFGCGYYNSMYNANRAFAEAERARARGEQGVARTSYNEAIEKAAGSYRRYPDSRWADDALLLIGRARFHLGQDVQAAAALRAMLGTGVDGDVRALGHAYLGAALARLDSTEVATVHLDSAVAVLSAARAEGALARRWRARAAFAAQDTATAWRYMEEAMQSREAAFEAALDAAEEATSRRDTLRLRHALSVAAAANPRNAQAETVNRVLREASRQGFEAAAFRASAPLDSARWAPAMVDAVMLERARLGVAAGADDAAIALAARLHGANATISNPARLLQARLTLRRVENPEELDAVRQLLLPAFAESQALELQRVIRAVQLLVGRASADGMLPLFAAAEIARDELNAPLLARTLFLRFVQLNPSSDWSGKAALAAHALGPTDATVAALATVSGNPYLAVAGGADPSLIALSEDRLARGLAGMRGEALAESVMRDVVAGRAAAVVDSTRTAARSDSLRIACTLFVDSLALKGIRADSVRAACQRSDSTRVAFVLEADTLELIPPDTMRTGLPPDTLQ